MMTHKSANLFASLVDKDRYKKLLNKVLNPDRLPGARPHIAVPSDVTGRLKDSISPEVKDALRKPAPSTPQSKPQTQPAPQPPAAKPVPKPVKKKSDPVLDNALVAAVEKVDVDEVKELLKKGANPNPDGKNTALRIALDNLYEKPKEIKKIAVALLENGASISAEEISTLQHNGSRFLERAMMANAMSHYEEFQPTLARISASRRICGAALVNLPDEMAKIVIAAKSGGHLQFGYLLSFLSLSAHSAACALPGEAGELVRDKGNEATRDMDMVPV